MSEIVMFRMPNASDESKLPDDWYDGAPKPCPGGGKQPRIMRTGEVTDAGEPMYFARCAYCDRPFTAGDTMESHTFVPVRVEDYTFRTGYVLEAVEPGTLGQYGVVIRCDGDHPMPRCTDPGCWCREVTP